MPYLYHGGTAGNKGKLNKSQEYDYFHRSRESGVMIIQMLGAMMAGNVALVLFTAAQMALIAPVMAIVALMS